MHLRRDLAFPSQSEERMQRSIKHDPCQQAWPKVIKHPMLGEAAQICRDSRVSEDLLKEGDQRYYYEYKTHTFITFIN